MSQTYRFFMNDEKSVLIYFSSKLTKLQNFTLFFYTQKQISESYGDDEMSDSRSTIDTNTAINEEINQNPSKTSAIQDIGNAGYRYMRFIGPCTFITAALSNSGMQPLMMRPIQAASPTLILAAEDLYDFFMQTSSPWQAIKNKGVKSIFFDIGKFSTSLVLNASLGVGVGFIEVLNYSTITSSHSLKMLFENSLCSTSVINTFSGLIIILNNMIYQCCSELCNREENTHIEDDEHTGFLKRFTRQLSRPIVPMFSALIINEIAGLNGVQLTYHAALFTPVFDQIYKGLNYITTTIDPFTKLNKEAQHNFKHHDEDYHEINDHEHESKVTAVDVIKWLSLYSGEALAEIAFCAAFVELAGMHMTWNTTTFFPLAILGTGCGIVAENIIDYAVTTRKSPQEFFAPVSNFFGGLFQRCKKPPVIEQDTEKTALLAAHV